MLLGDNRGCYFPERPASSDGDFLLDNVVVLRFFAVLHNSEKRPFPYQEMAYLRTGGYDCLGFVRGARACLPVASGSAV